MIRFLDVSKKFHSGGQDFHALQHVNLEIPKGDIFGVIGFSGAGKSTLLRMVNALEKPTEGHVEIDGALVDTLGYSELRQIRKDIGMVFQQFNLLESKTVFDNVAIPLVLQKEPRKEIAQRVEELLEFVELSDKKSSYPWQLSGGQKQRVGIARALATNPSILLCDEATSALDPETTESILQLLAKINGELGITILFVTHQIQVIQRICRHVAVMDGGTALEIFSAPRQPMTRRFVQSVIPDRIPESIRKDLKLEHRPFRLLKLRFLGDNAKENLLYQINTKIRVETSVLFASVTEIRQDVLGIFIVQFLGSEEKLEDAVAYIESQGVQWQEVIL